MDNSKTAQDEHEAKLKKLKQALENNTFAINSDRIAEALLEAKKETHTASSVDEPEMA
jgi:anti-sigma28 factor (negative regulator of flagellin synthesis)